MAPPKGHKGLYRDNTKNFLSETTMHGALMTSTKFDQIMPMGPKMAQYKGVTYIAKAYIWNT